MLLFFVKERLKHRNRREWMLSSISILIHQSYNDKIRYNDVIHVSSAKPTAEML